MTLPEYGIVVGKGVYSSTVSYYKEIKQHEYGHILQYKQFLSALGSKEAALSAYYQQVGAPSAISGILHRLTGGVWNHYTLAVEMEANRLSSAYFGSRYIPNPIKFPLNNAIFSFTVSLN